MGARSPAVGKLRPSLGRARVPAAGGARRAAADWASRAGRRLPPWAGPSAHLAAGRWRRLLARALRSAGEESGRCAAPLRRRPGGAHVSLCRAWVFVPARQSPCVSGDLCRGLPALRPFPARRQPGQPGASRAGPRGQQSCWGRRPRLVSPAPQPGFLSWPSAEGVSWCGLEAGCDCSAGPVSPSGGCRLLARVPAARPVAEPGCRLWLRMQAGAPGFACLSVRGCGGRARVAALDSV